MAKLGRLLPLCLLPLVACGDELAPAWQIRAFRLWGAKVENLSRAATDPDVSEAAPGERVRLTLSYVDPAENPRPLQVVWVFCAEARATATSFACDPRGASVLMGPQVEYTIPNITYGVDAMYRSRIQGVVLACAGGALGFDATTMLPTCTGEGAESWVMTRSIIVRTAETDPPNHNPAITEVVLLRNGRADDAVALDEAGTVTVPRCAGEGCPTHVIEVRVRDGSRESYQTRDTAAQVITQTERLQFGFFTAEGTLDNAFRVDSADRPTGPIRNTWTPPQRAATATFYLTAQDIRGGFDVARRAVTVQ